MDTMRELDACPICETAERTEVCPYNGLAVLDEFNGSDVVRYAYALCHGCGLVYATRRPDGATFAQLFENFDENLGRTKRKVRAFDDEQRADLRRRLDVGWAPSEEQRLAKKDWVPSLWDDRTSTAPHLVILSSLLDLRGARVLDVRTKTGALLDSLRSWFGADVYALPAFENEQAIIQEGFGIPAVECVDFADFRIPYEGQFDLIVAKHLFTHAVRPERVFEVFRRHLKPGGAIYLYVENDDAAMWERRKNLIGEMKCFHFQNFDIPTLGRALRRQGFEPTFIRHASDASAVATLARLDPDASFQPLTPDQLRERRDMYERWYDLSVLSLPESLASTFADERPAAAQRALARGDARRRLGRVMPSRPLRLMHEAGFAERNNGLGAVHRRLRARLRG
jgi:SAM-dependent methyltransferase